MYRLRHLRRDSEYAAKTSTFMLGLHLATITTMSPIPEHRGERNRAWSRIGVIVGERNGTWLNRGHRGHRDRF
ncbi:hypothetical protein DPMN_186952 [Dreissena polymorpha]|uniref:Uncharacterized protein n=1 Tax=Dreissena polymorpha TaxID=45954 RepID=A0A9D4DQV1_DREPO|nr:hypothetical protein DPMN_186730 [Dreissena polymorpha]KAH3752336.1 hypothetical protein DPMN_186952 [Dreissena polymorpha]